MKNNNMTGIILNPTRQRIVQYMLSRESCTVNELSKDLADIPRPSIYRHIKLLLEGGFIEVIDERAVRGTVEKRYAVKKASGSTEMNFVNERVAIDNAMRIATLFSDYFSHENADPARDMVGINVTELQLNDEELKNLLLEMEQVIKNYASKSVCEGSKLRRIGVVSAPNGFES